LRFEKKLGSEHSEQDRPDESERSEDRENVNPMGEKHSEVSPLVALAVRLPVGGSRGKQNYHPKVVARH